MSPPPLLRQPLRAPPSLSPVPEVVLTCARLHEACGPARFSFALWLAAQTEGPLFWIAPSWGAAPLHPAGVASFLNPGRITFVSPRRPEDLLWTMEETLRSGLVPMVVADLPSPPGLTPVRRLHLAAETGAASGAAPLGLILTPDRGGAQGVESRWHMAHAHTAAQDGWRLSRLRARTAPPQSWHISGLPQSPQLAPLTEAQPHTQVGVK